MAKSSQVSRPAARPRRPAPKTAVARARRARGAAITMVYIRPEGACETALDVRLAAVARRYAGGVVMQTVTAAEAGPLGTWAAPGSPAVVLVRRGSVIGQAMGDGLPVRELDQAVRRAVEWPATR